ncbi:MAG: flagellar hook-length control protein FliK, partial [Pusillimonas sp.]|nr:flagellar hook-length control protein FliK [Pusillimonas sp.]
MSVNSPSGLGTLLVQRLDAVLGTTLSQQTNIVNGARPDAITQTQEAQRNEAAQNRVTRETREAIDQVQRHGKKA